MNSKQAKNEESEDRKRRTKRMNEEDWCEPVVLLFA